MPSSRSIWDCLTTMLSKLWGLRGELLRGRGYPGRAEALASAPWLGSNIVPRSLWGQCLEVNKIFIV